MIYGIGKMEDGKWIMEEVKMESVCQPWAILDFSILHHFPSLLIISALKSLPSFNRLAKNDLAASKCSL